MSKYIKQKCFFKFTFWFEIVKNVQFWGRRHKNKAHLAEPGWQKWKKPHSAERFSLLLLFMLFISDLLCHVLISAPVQSVVDFGSSPVIYATCSDLVETCLKRGRCCKKKEKSCCCAHVERPTGRKSTSEIFF